MRCVLHSSLLSFLLFFLTFYTILCVSPPNTPPLNNINSKSKPNSFHPSTPKHTLSRFTTIQKRNVKKSHHVEKGRAEQKKINSIMLFVLTHHKTQTDYTLCRVKRAVCHTFLCPARTLWVSPFSLPSFFSCSSKKKNKEKLLVVRRSSSSKSEEKQRH